MSDINRFINFFKKYEEPEHRNEEENKLNDIIDTLKRRNGTFNKSLVEKFYSKIIQTLYRNESYYIEDFDTNEEIIDTDSFHSLIESFQFEGFNMKDVWNAKKLNTKWTTLNTNITYTSGRLTHRLYGVLEAKLRSSDTASISVVVLPNAMVKIPADYEKVRDLLDKATDVVVEHIERRQGDFKSKEIYKEFEYGLVFLGSKRFKKSQPIMKKLSKHAWKEEELKMIIPEELLGTKTTKRWLIHS